MKALNTAHIRSHNQAWFFGFWQLHVLLRICSSTTVLTSTDTCFTSATATGKLKENLIDELDYMLVPEEAWLKLVDWYGMMDGQVSIGRKVIEQGLFVKHRKVEVYLMDLKLCSYRDMETIVTETFSRADTIGKK